MTPGSHRRGALAQAAEEAAKKEQREKRRAALKAVQDKQKEALAVSLAAAGAASAVPHVKPAHFAAVGLPLASSLAGSQRPAARSEGGATSGPVAVDGSAAPEAAFSPSPGEVGVSQPPLSISPLGSPEAAAHAPALPQVHPTTADAIPRPPMPLSGASTKKAPMATTKGAAKAPMDGRAAAAEAKKRAAEEKAAAAARRRANLEAAKVCCPCACANIYIRRVLSHRNLPAITVPPGTLEGCRRCRQGRSQGSEGVQSQGRGSRAGGQGQGRPHKPRARGRG